MSILFYKRPKYVNTPEGPLDATSYQDHLNRSNQCKAAIPPKLSFEQIVGNKAAPPCSLQDFMNYLCYVTHDAENLQFYLWLADYYQRFQRSSPSEKHLSPKWQADEPYDSQSNSQPFPPLMSEKHLLTLGLKEQDISFTYPNVMAAPGINWQALASQPFRAEINRVAFHYIAPGSPRELKLSDQDRAAVLYALQQTTHPSAFTLVKRMLDSALRYQAHPNFIRCSICNGNRPRAIFLRSFAVMNITIGFAIAITLTLSSYPRYWRIFAAIEWWFGMTNLIASCQGLCVLLHRRHTRNIRPWETADDNSLSKCTHDEETGVKDMNVQYDNTTSRWPVKMEIFGAANNYNGEPWLPLEDKKSWWRRVSDCKITVHPGGLSIIQDKIIRQAEAWALIFTVPLTVGFVAIPKRYYF